MNAEQADRMLLGWSPEHLAHLSGVVTASVYLLERLGTAGEEDDRRIRQALEQGKAERNRRAAY